ncbi:chaperone modulator CbpM [Pseudotabrizicola sp. L79]|uniref:chaperone modulator CbpM n=1 Tax=Pseudotabrizicola sp. L79 TaxID=3118402 RepID=UPI002F93EA06
MTERLSENDVVAAVTRLTRSQLFRFVEGELVRPERSDDGYVFRRVDIARLELLCDLSEDLEMDETGVAIVISLIDQLHAARQELAMMARAVDALPPDVQARIMAEINRP